MKFYYYLVFIFLTLFTPLAFGGSEPWGLFTFNLTCLAFGIFILFKKHSFIITPVSKIVLYMLGFLILLAFLQLFNQHNFLQKPAYLPFTLCRYYSLEGLSLLFSVSMLYFALTQTAKHTEEIKKIILIMTVNAVIVTLISIGFRTEFIYYFSGVKMLAAFGPFASRNHGGQFVMISFFLSLFLWLPHFILVKKQRLPRKNIYYFIFSIILFASVFATHSRGGVIALILGLFILLFLCVLYSHKQSYEKISFLTVATIIFMVLIHLIITYSTTFGLRQFWTGSDSARLGLYSAAIDMLGDFPYTGVGFDAFSTAIDAYIPFALKTFPRYLHNDWLELLLSFGYIAGTIILWLIFVIIFDITKLFKNLEPKKQIRLFILCAGLSGFTFTGIVDFPFHLPACAFLFFITLAFVSANTFTAKAKEIYLPVIFKIVLICLSCFLLWQNFQYVCAWRNFVFVRQFAPQIQAKELSTSLEYYPSPKYIRHALTGKYRLFKSKTITEEQRQEIKEDIHYLAGFYLQQYPQDATLSRLFVLTK